jgi:hypothetical protein
MDHPTEAKLNASLYQFLIGVVIGQLILISIILGLIKLIFLSTNPPRRRIPPPTSTVKLHDKTLPNDETCEWLNILMKQVMEKYRTREFQMMLYESLQRALNMDRPTFLNEIFVDVLNLGYSSPSIKNVHVGYRDTHRFTFDVEWISPSVPELDSTTGDDLSFGVSTQLVLHYPRPNFATLPVSLALAFSKFIARVEVWFDDALYVSFSDDFELEFAVMSLLGENTKMKDLPKLSSVIVDRIRSVVRELFCQGVVRFDKPGNVEMLRLLGIPVPVPPELIQLPVPEHQGSVGKTRKRSIHLGSIHQHEN